MIAFWLRLFFRLTAVAPWATAAAKPLFVRLAYLFAPTVRRATRLNAQRIFQRPLSRREARAYALHVIGNFYEFVFDVARSLRATREQLAQRIEAIEGHERYAAIRAAGRGAIILTAHMGSFELGMAALTALGERVHVVFRRDRVDAFEELRRTLRARLGVTEASLDDSWTVWLRLREALRDRNDVVAIQGDRVMPGQRGICVQVLGGHLELPSGPVKLASASGAPIVPVFCVRLDDGRVKLIVEEAIEVANPLDDAALADAMRRIAALLAKYILAYPDQWLLFQPAFVEDARAESTSP